jgi:hypothetical protein
MTLSDLSKNLLEALEQIPIAFKQHNDQRLPAAA